MKSGPTRVKRLSYQFVASFLKMLENFTLQLNCKSAEYPSAEELIVFVDYMISVGKYDVEFGQIMVDTDPTYCSKFYRRFPKPSDTVDKVWEIRRILSNYEEGMWPLDGSDANPCFWVKMLKDLFVVESRAQPILSRSRILEPVIELRDMTRFLYNLSKGVANLSPIVTDSTAKVEIFGPNSPVDDYPNPG